MRAHGAAKERLYRELMASRDRPAPLVPGVREFLERYAGAPFGVATNAEPENVDFVLDTAGLRRYFQVVIDGNQVRMPKPDPEIYLRAAARLGRAGVRLHRLRGFPAGPGGCPQPRACGPWG